MAGCDTSDPATDTVLARAMFVDKGGQSTDGFYRIERTAAGDLRLVLENDFQTDAGPDLHVLLSPLPVDEAGNGNANGPGARIVAPLMHTSGGQVYDLPDDLPLASFQSVLIHCVQFSHLFGAAPTTN